MILFSRTQSGYLTIREKNISYLLRCIIKSNLYGDFLDQNYSPTKTIQIKYFFSGGKINFYSTYHAIRFIFKKILCNETDYFCNYMFYFQNEKMGFDVLNKKLFSLNSQISYY